MQTKHTQFTLFIYALTVFLSSAVVMILEISAGRLLAPYIGVSLYTWTSIIGVILAGLSFGSWIGGQWADNGATERGAGAVLFIAGIASILSLFLLTLIAPALQQSQLNLVGISFIYMLVLFFTPAVLLGIVTPLLTTLALKLDNRAGHIVGRMHALAALGSILGTFLTGYWLVQQFGTRNVIAGSALVLLVLSVPFMRHASRVALGSLTVLLLGSIVLVQSRDGFSSPCAAETNYFCISFDDVSQQAPFGEAKAMILDHLMHGVNHREEPGMLLSPYVHLMDELTINYFGGDRADKLKYFFAGGGAYTQPRAVKYFYPDSHVTVAELDSRVTAMAEREMFLESSGMRIIHQDARMALTQLENETFDVIVNDVFHDISVPYHLITREYLQLVNSRLNQDGLFLMNIVDIFPGADLTKAILKTLQLEFKHVDAWLEQIPKEPGRVTYVISAGNHLEQPEVLFAQRGFQRRWLNISEPLMQTGTPLQDLPILTDNYVPVERLISSLLLSNKGN